jgi:signal peptide peptidase SppA
MSNAFLLRIADRVLDRPLLILPDKLAIITEVLAGRIGVEGIVNAPDGAELADASFMQPRGSRFVGEPYDRDENGKATKYLPYKRTASGIAIVTITGSLVNRGAWVGANSGLTSYEGIGHQIESAARDPKAKSIVLDIESPGGEAVGAMETSAMVRKVAREKPVYAMVNGMAASAAYAIAAGATAIFSTESGIAGSIGVVLLHSDHSRRLDREGITPTLIHAGAHKVDGNPFTPLSPAVKADLQTEVNHFYSLFVDAVAAGRRGMTKDAVRGTEARTFIGRAAKEAGLVDDIGTFADLVGSLSKASFPMGMKGQRMNLHSDEDMARARAEGRAEGLEEGRKAGHDAGFAAGKAEGLTEGRAAGLEEGKGLGAIAERERVSAILASPEAKGRESSAQHLALKTGMTLAEAEGVLAGVARSSSIGARAAETVITGGDHGNPPEAKADSVFDGIVANLNATIKK